jgi:hypothetical protein
MYGSATYYVVYRMRETCVVPTLIILGLSGE